MQMQNINRKRRSRTQIGNERLMGKMIDSRRLLPVVADLQPVAKLKQNRLLRPTKLIIHQEDRSIAQSGENIAIEGNLSQLQSSLLQKKRGMRS